MSPSSHRTRAGRAVAALLAAGVTVALVAVPGAAPSQAAAGAAPGAPGTPSDWVPGDKDGFGTARGTASKVWYTLSRGTLNEVFYPRIDTPSLRDSQFVVTDGSTFTDREDRDSTHQVQLLSSDSLTYRLVNTAKSGAWRITKTFVTDPTRSSVLEDVRFESLTGKEYQVYLLHDVALSMTGNDDTGRTARRRTALLGRHQRQCGASRARRSARPRAATSGPPTAGPTSPPTTPWTGPFDAASPGNVVQTGRVQRQRPAEPPALHRLDRLRRRRDGCAVDRAGVAGRPASPPPGRRTTRAGPATSGP